MEQVSTVDAFQGAEKDFIFLSCCRTSPDKRDGHTNDARRLNVAFTRARNHLFVIGSAKALQQGAIWKKVLSVLQGRKAVIHRASAISFLSSLPADAKVVEQQHVQQSPEFGGSQDSMIVSSSSPDDSLLDHQRYQLQMNLQEESEEAVVEQVVRIDQLVSPFR
jgi:ATP-dependent exoDNAse (exonuclease V) beta subunit